jgi:hypothetical protein
MVGYGFQASAELMRIYAFGAMFLLHIAGMTAVVLGLIVILIDTFQMVSAVSLNIMNGDFWSTSSSLFEGRSIWESLTSVFGPNIWTWLLPFPAFPDFAGADYHQLTNSE